MKQEGGFWIEFAPPLTDKLEKLKQFTDEHDELGPLDKKYLNQVLTELGDMRVTRFKANVHGKARSATWTTFLTINNKKEFEGSASNFGEALLVTLENVERYLLTARTG